MLLILFCVVASGYKIADVHIFNNPTTYSVCDVLRETVNEAIKELPFQAYESDAAVNTICTVDTNAFYARTQTIQDDNGLRTAIEISDRLLSYTNTLYNVLLHEMLHSVGLKHSTESGVMNYSIFTTRDTVMEDIRRIWLSSDDILGLYYLLHHRPTSP
jgi:hypothetical protein